MTQVGGQSDWWPKPPDPPAADLQIVPMTIDQIDEILVIENACFPVPWHREAFEYDLLKNKLGHYWTLLQNGTIIGHAGFWLVDHIAHLTTMCVSEENQGRGIGRWLLLEVMKMGSDLGALRFTLEVRESNERAIKLYEAVGYRIAGRRIGYYAEIHEDALIMWTGGPPYEG